MIELLPVIASAASLLVGCCNRDDISCSYQNRACCRAPANATLHAEYASLTLYLDGSAVSLCNSLGRHNHSGTQNCISMSWASQCSLQDERMPRGSCRLLAGWDAG